MALIQRLVPAASYMAVPGSYYTVPGWTGISFASSGQAQVAGVLLYTPIRVDFRALFDRASWYVVSTGGTGSKLRGGVYSDAGGRPGRLIADWGQVTTDLTATATEITIAWRPNPGIYWLAYVCDGTPTLGSNHAAAGGGPPLPFQAATITTASTSNVNGYATVTGQLALVAGGLPSTAVAPTGRQSTGNMKLRLTVP